METGSYLLVGTDRAVDETFGSTMHGFGTDMSQAQAKKQVRGEQLQQQMKQRGILVKAVSMSGLAEEADCLQEHLRRGGDRGRRRHHKEGRGAASDR